ncbi:MAG: c-type cytochrome [Aggregatilineales bacterium]
MTIMQILKRFISHRGLIAGTLLLIVPVSLVLLAQDTPTENPDCTPERLVEQQGVFAQLVSFDAEVQPDLIAANLYRLGSLYQQLAANCGYQPSEQEINDLIQLTLLLTDLETIIAAQATGTDVAAIMIELETVAGDSFNGQLLYNGIEFGLDGNALGCSGCHQGESAPLTGATWTRIVEERLTLPEFADYTAEQYAVESIVLPEHYIVPEYQPGLMPGSYGSRMDIQQLADVIAFLRSHDEGLVDDE